MVGWGVGLSAAAVAAGCGTREDSPADPRDPGAPGAPRVGRIVDVTAFGAVGDGRTDATDAVARAVASSQDPVALHFPAGVYRVTAFPTLRDFTTVTGDGADLSTLLYDGDDTLIRLRGRQRVAFRSLGVFLTGERGTAVSLSNCFRCSFDAVVIRGNHTSDTHPRYIGQRGVVLDENTGGTAFLNCDINNFGVGLTTRCILNYVTSSKFTSNFVGVLGAGTDFNAGLALVNTEFVSDSDPRTTSTHIRVEGAANDWWLTNVWFEGCDIGLDLGGDTGGPAQLGLVNVKIGARRTGIVLRACRQPYLANVSFDADTDAAAGPQPLIIDPARCGEGTAINLVSSTADDVPLETFPPGWTVIARGVRTGGTVATPTLWRAPAVADSPDAAPVLRDDAGGFWQLTVGADGALGTRPHTP